MALSNGGHAPDPSAALAEKLLQGWALLQEHCPQCLTPLVRNRQRRMYCVACEQWILTQSEAAQHVLRERVGEGAEGDKDERQRRRRSSEPVAPETPHESPAVNSNQGEDGRLEQLSHSDRRENSSVPEVDRSSENLKRALSKISSILAYKLEELGDNLLRSHDLESTRLAMVAVRECLQILSEVKHLQI